MKTTQTVTKLQTKTARIYTNSPIRTYYRAIQGNTFFGYETSRWTTDMAAAEKALVAMTERGTAWCEVAA